MVLTAVYGWSDGVLLVGHALLALSSSWLINVCFVGADVRAAERHASAAVRERTGMQGQGLILTGVMVGLGLSTIIATVREQAGDAASE